MNNWIALFVVASFYLIAEAQNASAILNETITFTEEGPIYNKTLSQYKHPYLLLLRYDLIEEETATLLNEIALRNIRCTPVNLPQCFNLSIFDVMSAINLNDYPVSQIAEALADLNVSRIDSYNMVYVYNMTWPKFGDLVHEFGITISELYNNIVNSMPNPNENIPLILDTLNINKSEFSSAFLFGSEADKINVLSSGTYSEEAVDRVLEIINLTTTELLLTIPLQKVIVGLQSKKINEVTFINFIKNYGLNSSDISSFYSSLQLSTEDLHSIGKFQETLALFLSLLNKADVIGTAISQNQILTSKKAAEVFSQKFIFFANGNLDAYARFQGHLVENVSEVFAVSSSVIAPAILSNELILYANEYPHPRFANVSLSYNTSSWLNCLYLSKALNGDLYQEVVNVSLNTSYLSTPKSNATVYNLGSPVFCMDKLHGIATDQDETLLKYTPMLPEVVKPPPAAHAASIRVTSNTFICLILGITIKHLF